MIPFPVELRRDLLDRPALLAQFDDPVDQLIVVSQGFVARNRAHDLVPGRDTIMPPDHCSAHSLSARTWTTTRSTTKRIISLRSAAVVSGAFQRVGRLLDTAWIRARWSSLR